MKVMKKALGRPRMGKGRRVSVGIGLEPEVLEKIDKQAEKIGVSRSEMVNLILRRSKVGR